MTGFGTLLLSLYLPVLVFFHREPWIWTAATAGWLTSGAVTRKFRAGWVTLPPLAMSAAGFAQLFWNTTASREATLVESLLWVGLGAIAAGASSVLNDSETRDRFLHWCLAFGAFVAVLSLVQFYTSEGHVYWLIPTDLDRIWGPFRNRNHMAAFLELFFPIALWRSVTNPRRRFEYAAIATMIAAPVVLGGSRAGIALLALEGSLVLLAGRFRVLAAVLGVAGLLMTASQLTVRDSGHRLDLDRSALDMIRARPLTGLGLGAFESAYPAYAYFDNGLIVDHAHNDWLEWAAEVGVPAMLPLLAVALWAGAKSMRHPWALGAPALFLHAFVDYPLHKPALAAWTFALLGALYATTRDAKTTLLRD